MITNLAQATGYTKDVDGNLVDAVKEEAQSWALLHGLVIKPKPQETTDQEQAVESSLAAIPAPIALLPTPFPDHCFEAAYDIHPLLNELYHQASQDRDFIDQVVEPVTHGDPFTRRLYEIYVSTRDNPNAQKVTLDINRSDYMVDTTSDTPQIKQIEFNTVAVSFSSLSALTGDLHRHLSQRTKYGKFLPGATTMLVGQIPENKSLKSVAEGLAKAHELYDDPFAKVLIIVQPGERNKFDQLHIQQQLFDNHNVHSIRKSLSELSKIARVDPDTNKLYVEDEEISVAYFRSGYAPTDYPTEAEWNVRKELERSLAINAPSVAYQLVGCKKVQQVLANPKVLERFVKNSQDISDITNVFAGLYPLDQSESGIKAYEAALKDSSNMVLKPQREGGGYNIYKNDIPPFLKSLSKEERSSYILMDLVKPPVFGNWVLKDDGKAIYTNVVNELGIYGVFISDGSQTVYNSAGGYLLRTKPSDVDEGGVASGFGVLDSPILVDPHSDISEHFKDSYL